MDYKAEQQEKEILAARDPQLGAYMKRAGDLSWPLHEDLFATLVYEILGQQISLIAAQAVRKRVREAIVPLTPRHVASCSIDELKALGMTARKAEYIQTLAKDIENGSVNLEKLRDMDDQQALKYLLKIKGVGVWTAEMVLMFGLGRRDIFSWLDIAVRRGVMRIHHLDSIDEDTFEKYRKLYTPYGSTASLYFWQASHDKELAREVAEAMQAAKEMQDASAKAETGPSNDENKTLASSQAPAGKPAQ